MDSRNDSAGLRDKRCESWTCFITHAASTTCARRSPRTAAGHRGGAQLRVARSSKPWFSVPRPPRISNSISHQRPLCARIFRSFKSGPSAEGRGQPIGRNRRLPLDGEHRRRQRGTGGILAGARAAGYEAAPATLEESSAGRKPLAAMTPQPCQTWATHPGEVLSEEFLKPLAGMSDRMHAGDACIALRLEPAIVASAQSSRVSAR